MKTVCVTGGGGYLGSSLVKDLLERGYTVHATLRNLRDESKVGILKGLANAEENLKLFEADIYNKDEFERAINGCEVVVHMATPMQHYPHNSQYKNTSEAAVGGVKSIMESCIRSRTVKKVIYTASVLSASPLKEDGTGFKDSIDESCWTPLNLSYPFAIDFLTDYVHSKTLAEKEILSYDNNSITVVSLACGLVGGDTILSSMGDSNGCIVSPITNHSIRYQSLRFVEEVLGKIPIVHIQDISNAHIFCIENSSICGRFLCANAYISSAEIASYYHNLHPDIQIDDKVKEVVKRGISWGSTKFKDVGFEYKYDMKMILDDSFNSAKERNELI